MSNSIHDYRYLRDRGYPPGAALKLVGDRFQLSRQQRNMLFRGVMPRAEAVGRSRRLAPPGVVPGGRLAVDWYNVLITVESYLKGQPVFVSDDGLVRDASAVHGSYREGSVTEQAMGAILHILAAMRAVRVTVALDAPIAFSGRMAERLRSGLDGIAAQVMVVPSADGVLKTHGGAVASSDTVILDAASRIVDLPHAVLRDRFGFDPPPVEELLARSFCR